MAASTTLIVVLLVAFVLMPSAPDGILGMFHHPVISIAVLGLLLWLTTKSPGLGILALLTFGALYLERNRRILSFVYGAPRMPEDRHFPVSPSLRFVPYEKPTVSRLPFEPAGGCAANSNDWSAVGTSINEKRVLTTVPPGSATWPVLAKEFAN